jgi:ribosomal protein S18 acetylase RimI-like enzyme
MTAARIVAISEKHITGFREALDVVAREKKYLAMTKAFPPAETRKFVRNGLAKGNPHFVALAGARVVGWADIQRVPRDTMQHVGVLGIGIVPEYRERGIGRLLMERVIEEAWKRGITRVELTVRADNERAAALYRALGFVDEGVRRNAFLVDGRYYDLRSMALLRE